MTGRVNSLETKDLLKIQSLPGNDQCFECSSPNPTWCSLSFGILLCLKCSGLHRGLGTHISFVRSLEMDHFAKNQIERMLAGGNQLCQQYLEHGDAGLTLDSIIARGDKIIVKYDNELAMAYKKWLSAKSTHCKTQAKSFQMLKEQLEEAQKKKHCNIDTVHKITKVGDEQKEVKRRSFANTGESSSLLDLYLLCLKDTYCYPNFATQILLGCLSMLFVWNFSNQKNVFDQGTLIAISCCFVLFPLILAVSYQQNQSSASPVAIQDFTDRAHTGRAKRNLGYDLFFPPGVSVGDAVDTAFIFYPDSCTDFMVYAKALGHVSDRGILVALINTEPSRVVSKSAGLTSQHAENIMYEIQTLLGIRVIRTWAVGGHCMGGEHAYEILKDLSLKISDKIQMKGVFWGTCRDYENEINTQRQENIMNFLTVTTIKDLGHTEGKEKNAKDLSKHQHALITGGDKFSFGNYSLRDLPKDDKSKDGEISTLDQHNRPIIEATINFLQSERLKSN